MNIPITISNKQLRENEAILRQMIAVNAIIDEASAKIRSLGFGPAALSDSGRTIVGYTDDMVKVQRMIVNELKKYQNSTN